MIYFIQDGPEGPIKIGTTIRLKKRLEEFKKEYGPDLTVLAVLDGAYAEERSLHERFSYSRLSREWFVSSTELMDLIKTEGREWDGVDEASGLIDVRIRVDPEFYRRIQAAADEEGNSVAAFIRAVVIKELDRRERKAAE